MSDEDESREDSREEQIELLADHSSEIVGNREDISWVFEDIFQADRIHNNFSDYF